MAWIIGIVILILLVISSGFRKFAGMLVLVAGVGGFIYYQIEQNEEKNSLKRVKASELVFEDVKLQPSYGSYDIVGRITNTSGNYTVNKVKLKITFRDCKNKNQTDCIVISDETEEMYLRIPPKQARDFKKGIYLSSNTKAKGNLVWNYNVLAVTAK